MEKSKNKSAHEFDQIVRLKLPNSKLHQQFLDHLRYIKTQNAYHSCKNYEETNVIEESRDAGKSVSRRRN